jgi:hypothetical protein
MDNVPLKETVIDRELLKAVTEGEIREVIVKESGEDKKIVETPLPFGKVRLVDGQIVDRSKCHFKLQQNQKDPSFFKSQGTGTVYKQQKDGSLINVTKPNLTKAEKKAAKRAKHKELSTP